MSLVSEDSPQYPAIGIYEHYKSNDSAKRYYYLMGFARHTETEEILAIYIPLYVEPEFTGVSLQARPLSMFMEEVQIEGQRVPRFQYIGLEMK